jgi:hypothetical protein
LQLLLIIHFYLRLVGPIPIWWTNKNTWQGSLGGPLNLFFPSQQLIGWKQRWKPITGGFGSLCGICSNISII